MARKLEQTRLKRLIAISKIHNKHGADLSAQEIANLLQKDFGITVVRQTVLLDLKWLEKHNLDEYTAQDKQLLLEVDRDELTAQYNYVKDLRDRAKAAGDIKSEISASKTMREILVSRTNVDKLIDEIKNAKEASSRPVYNITIGKPLAYSGPNKNAKKTGK
jgi:hypothetical protein